MLDTNETARVTCPCGASFSMTGYGAGREAMRWSLDHANHQPPPIFIPPTPERVRVTIPRHRSAIRFRKPVKMPGVLSVNVDSILGQYDPVVISDWMNRF